MATDTDREDSLSWRNLEPDYDERHAVEIRIGIQNSPREISFETSETAADLQKTIVAALNDGEKTLTLTDAKGSTYLIPAEAIAYVELGTDSSRRVGFVS